MKWRIVEVVDLCHQKFVTSFCKDQRTKNYGTDWAAYRCFRNDFCDYLDDDAVVFFAHTREGRSKTQSC